MEIDSKLWNKLEWKREEKRENKTLEREAQKGVEWERSD